MLPRPCLPALTAALLLCASAALAQEPDPRLKAFVIEDVVNEDSKIMVRVDVDHADRTYYEGEPLVVKLIADKDCYVYLLDVNSMGQATCLFPNVRQKNNFVKANVEVHVPGPGDTFKLATRAPFGEDVLCVLATQQPGDQIFQGKNLRTGNVTALSSRDIRGIKGNIGAFAPEPDWAEHRITVTTFAGQRTTPPPGVKHKRAAVVIGINRYKDRPTIPDLSLCEQDAARMQQVLESRCGVAEVIPLLGQAATREAIRQAIFEKMRDRTSPGDTVVIYFSGHGGRSSATDRDDPDGGNAYLVPWDGVFARAQETMIMDDTFGRWLNELQGREVLVILDNCYSGAAARTLPNKAVAARLAKGLPNDLPRAGIVIGARRPAAGAVRAANALEGNRAEFIEKAIRRVGSLRFSKDISGAGTVLIAASKADQIAFEMPGGDGSVLTHFVVNALNVGDDPFSASGLFDRVEKSVVDYVRQTLIADQNPLLVGKPTTMIVRPGRP